MPTGRHLTGIIQTKIQVQASGMEKIVAFSVMVIRQTPILAMVMA
jgi:hypothetical protein